MLGLSIGTGDPGAGASDKRTWSGAVPSLRVLAGKPVMRVRTVGFTGGFSATGVVGVVGGLGVASPAGRGAAGVVWTLVPLEEDDVLANATPVGAIATSTNATACLMSLLAVKVPPWGCRRYSQPHDASASAARELSLTWSLAHGREA
jgi:hypothetical protein